MGATIKRNSKARVIKFSAMGQQSMLIEAIQTRTKCLVVRPFQADRVVEAVAKALK